jgi:hypothetical protein
LKRRCKNRVVELARHRQRPEIGALALGLLRRGGRGIGRAADGDGGEARLAVELDRDVPVPQPIGSDRALQGLERNSRLALGAVGAGGQFLGAGANGFVEPRIGHHLVDQPPGDGALAPHAFLGGAEHVGEIAPNLALVGDAGEPAGAGQHGKQRHLGKRHAGRAVVGQNDVVGGQRQLVSAAGRGAVDGADPALAGMVAGILHGIAGLVGELAEIDLVAVAGAGQHADIGAGREDAGLARAQDHGPGFRVLEAQALDRVVQLDVDAEVVGVELQLVALEQARRLVHIEDEFGHRPAGDQPPVPIAGWIGGKVDLPGTFGSPCLLLGRGLIIGNLAAKSRFNRSRNRPNCGDRSVR